MAKRKSMMFRVGQMLALLWLTSLVLASFWLMLLVAGEVVNLGEKLIW